MIKIDKKYERQKRIEETQKSLENLVAKYEENVNKYIILAAEAKADNRISDYNQTLKFLDVVMKRKAQAKSMLHQFKLVELMRDDAKVLKNFADSITIISKETSKLFKDSTMRKAAKDLRKITENDEKNQMLFDAFVETNQESISNFESSQIEARVDKETLARVDAEVERIKNRIDATSDDRLKELLGK